MIHKNTDNNFKPMRLITVNNNYEFITIKSILEDNKIQYSLQDDSAESYLRIRTGIHFGRTDFFVNTMDYKKAKDLVDRLSADDEKLEKMDDFFTAIVDIYETDVLGEVEGIEEACKIMAKNLPQDTKELLDLGCGTGFELDQIFKFNPNVNVTGIDLTQAMLDRIKDKYSNKNLNLICGNYFDVPLEKEKFDAAISFESLHYFTHEEKTGLYRKIFETLKLGSCYVECDYMVESQKEENFYFCELQRLKKEQNISDDELVYYDIPCTIKNQIKMLKKAGFSEIEKIYQEGATVILKAKKL